MKKAIVLGGAGFIGSHMSKRLKDEGYFVSVIDRKMPEFGFAPADEYHLFDLRNPIEYFGDLRLSDADVVYQFAAEMGGAEYIFSGENDANIMQSSAQINLNVLEACRKAGIKQVFFASSACVYQSLDGVESCREDEGINPDSGYGLEKLFAESLYDSYRRNYGIDCKVGRFHNIYGAYGTWRGGREKAPAAFMRKIAETPEHGTIECFGDGSQTRSFLHVDEACEGVWRLMQSDFAGPVNIGSSEMVSISKMIAMIGDIAQKEMFVKHIGGPLGVRGRNSDNRLISEKLKWHPTQTLRAGLERTYPWIAEQVAKAVDGTKTTK